MIIDTQKTLTKIKLRRFVIAMVFMVLIVLTISTDIFDLYFTKYFYTMVFAVLYILIYAFQMFLKLNYIYFSDEESDIILRYFTIQPFKRAYRSIEIPKNTFVKFKVEKSIFNLKEDIILFQRTKKGIAKYPAVSISSLSKEERNKIKECLTKYVTVS